MKPQRRSRESLTKLLNSFGTVLNLNTPRSERPMFGTMISLARCSIMTRSGIFKANIFQDLINKGYVIALTRGKMTGKAPLLTRIHSSCVTSETLRALDSDDIQQLEAAIDVIAKRGRGVLFYLIQEGRGVGFIAKARDRMIVQASQNSITTHEAFTLCGLDADYRDYRPIPSICHLLGITSPFIVLTNNPDKLESLRSLGLNIAGSEILEVDPGAHNIEYLSSKAKIGHTLSKTSQVLVQSAVRPRPVTPFRPYALSDAARFIHAATYLLPMKPVDGEIILTSKEWQILSKKIKKTTPGNTLSKLIKSTEKLPCNRTLIQIDRTALKKHKTKVPTDPVVSLLSVPYWFKIHAYYDIVSSQDFIVLEYGELTKSEACPVRIQSESLFNRLPLENVENRDKFKSSVQYIVREGHGLIVLLHNDGRGAGFGAYATDLMFIEEGQAQTSEDSYQIMGLEYDMRDFGAAARLVKHHVQNNPIHLISSSPAGLAKKPETMVALSALNISVTKLVFL